MAQPETVLLEIIETGPCDRRELIQVAPALMAPEIDIDVRPSNIPELIDRLNSLGFIGCTGAKLDTIVISRLGQSVLNSN